jgi:acyl-CoA dehydrogenase
MKDFASDERFPELREALRAACEPFGPAYWQKVDEERGFPEEFVQMLTQGGWLSAMIPSEFGGSGLGLAEASVIMEEINRNGGNAGFVHGTGPMRRRSSGCRASPRARCACSRWA